MNSRVETTNVKLDTLKLIVALAVFIGGLAAFYVFAGESMLVRVGGLVASIIVAVLIGLQTEKGRAAWAFIQEAQTEVRMVVWPTRQETFSTTGVVILMVVFFAIVMWLLDIALGWLIKFVFGQ